MVPTTGFKQPPAGKHHIVAASCRLLAKRAVPAKLQLISFCNEVLYSPGPSNSENQRPLCNFETLYQDSKLITVAFQNYPTWLGPAISRPANSIFSPSWLGVPVGLELLQLTDLRLQLPFCHQLWCLWHLCNYTPIHLEVASFVPAAGTTQ